MFSVVLLEVGQFLWLDWCLPYCGGCPGLVAVDLADVDDGVVCVECEMVGAAGQSENREDKDFRD